MQSKDPLFEILIQDKDFRDSIIEDALLYEIDKKVKKTEYGFEKQRDRF